MFAETRPGSLVPEPCCHLEDASPSDPSAVSSKDPLSRLQARQEMGAGRGSPGLGHGTVHRTPPGMMALQLRALLGSDSHRSSTGLVHFLSLGDMGPGGAEVQGPGSSSSSVIGFWAVLRVGGAAEVGASMGPPTLWSDSQA